MTEDRHPRLCQPHHPGNGKQESQARHHGETHHTFTRRRVVLGEPADEDGKKDNVVDSQHNLEGSQCAQGDPGLRVCQPFKHQCLPYFM